MARTSSEATSPLKKKIRVTIPDTGTVSNEAIDFRDYITMCIETGPDFDGVILGFEASTHEPEIRGLGGDLVIGSPSGIYTTVFNMGADLSITAAASKSLTLAAPEVFAIAGCAFLKITAGAQAGGDTVLDITLSS